MTERQPVTTAAIFVGTLAVYLSFLTKQYYWDGVTFALAIETSQDWRTLLHPNHLLYEPLGSIFYRICQAVWPGIRAITALQILSAISGSASAAMMYTLLRRIVRDNYIAVCLAVLFAFTATWWRFATDADAYIPAIACLLLCSQLLTRERGAVVGAVVSFAAAMCLHQLSLIALPALVLIIWSRSASRERVHRTTSFILLSGCLTIGLYGYAFYEVTGSTSPANFLRWITSFSPDADTAFEPIRSLTMTLRGNVRLFFGGRMSWLRGLVGPLAMGVIGVGAAALIGLVVQSVRARGARAFPDGRGASSEADIRTLLRAGLVWVGSYTLFLFFWLPQNTFYRLFYLPAIFFVLAAMLARRSRTGYYRLALLTTALTTANFLFLIYPLSHVDRNPPLKLALELHDTWPEGTHVVIGRNNPDANLVHYFNQQAEWQSANTTDPSALISSMTARGTPVWLETTAIDALSSDPMALNWLEEHTVPGSRHEIDNGDFRVRFRAVQP
ncbi:MAG TPA: hypothetical protein VL501_04800 [Pyrinomonadaceae bacterium]|nr:hypothetical protein [Pyrinomonadaceae bacterium]